MLVPMLRVAALSAVLASSAATVALAQTTPAPAAPAAKTAEPDPVVARVNGKEVRRTEFLAALEQLPPQVQQMPLQQIYQPLLEQIVNSKLVADAAYKAKLQDSKEVKAKVKQAEERFVQEAYLVKQIDSKITEAGMRKKYDEWVKANPPQDEVRARHILTKTKEEADAVIKQLAGGADFAKLAAEQKIDTAAASQQGDLGYFVADEMVEPFSKAAFAMKAGEVSKAPVETQFGFHVIKVEDKRKRTPPTFEQAAPQIREAMAQEIAGTIVEDLRKTAKIEVYGLDGSALPAATTKTPAGDAPITGGNRQSAPAPTTEKKN
ncbi:MAG TPA: peptidylprolyl isomerase [Azospirillaceae bacterium]|nr:peptidylprolyl isomerase [Azospirillaceae bacterium]